MLGLKTAVNALNKEIGEGERNFLKNLTRDAGACASERQLIPHAGMAETRKSGTTF